MIDKKGGNRNFILVTYRMTKRNLNTKEKGVPFRISEGNILGGNGYEVIN